MKQVKCPNCNGTGKIESIHRYGYCSYGDAEYGLRKALDHIQRNNDRLIQVLKDGEYWHAIYEVGVQV